MLKVDDDFTSFISFEGGMHNKVDDIKILDEVIERLFIMTTDAKTRLFTFAPTPDLRRYDMNKPFDLFSSIKIGIYGLVLGDGYRFDERFLLKQDIDMALDTVLKYRYFIVENRYSFTYRPTMNNVGGCGEYRTLKKELEIIDLLRRKWGNTYIKPSTSQSKANMTINVKYPLR